MMSRWSVGSLVPIYLHSLLAGWLVLCCLVLLLTYTPVSVFYTYAFLQSNMYLRQLKLPIFVFGSVLLF